MSQAPKTPREGCAWTTERVEQFKKMEEMLQKLASLNNGSDFIGKVQKCIATAKELTDFHVDGSKQGYLQFMRDQIIKDRFGESVSPASENNGKKEP